VREITTDRTKINRAFPFMKNFPFGNEFSMEVAEAQVMAMMFDEEFSTASRSNPSLINFTNTGSPSKMVISMYPGELEWIGDVADSVKNLDKIAKRIDKGLKAKDIFLKRDIVMESDLWLNGIKDRSSTLSKETFNDVIQSLLGGKSLDEAVSVINSVNKLYTKKGVVKISKENLNVIFTYFHFRLVYAKLILGIVIASKISL
jgi:hypothetical protein